MTAVFPKLGDPRYVLFTTYTRDGRPKPTPVWAARDGDRLLVISRADAWKVKRVRNSGRATLTACDVRGRPRGESVEADALVLDPSATPAVYRALKRRYGLLGRIYAVLSTAQGGNRHNVGIALTPPGSRE